MALQITITNAGRAEIIAAENTGTNQVTITAVALGTGRYAPSKTQTALQAEVKRVTSIAGQAVAADTIHVMALDESTATYNVGEFGLISDKGTLIAIYSQLPAVGWIISKAPASTLLLATDIILESLDALNITFGNIAFINPPATVDTPGVVQLDDTLTSTSRSKALTALQGKVLADQVATKATKATTLAGYGVSFASQTEAETGADTSKPMSALRVFQAIAAKVIQATESALGIARIATQHQVNAGTDDTTIVTPKKFMVAHSYANLGGKPTTLGGYGITDAVPVFFSGDWADLTASRFLRSNVNGPIGATIVGGLQSVITSGGFALNVVGRNGRLFWQTLGDSDNAWHEANAWSALTNTPTTLSGYGVSFASQTEAETGADTNKPMSALRVFQAIAAKVIQATESALGIARIATQLQLNAGIDDTTIVTPKKLRLGVTYSFGNNGYIFLPQWLGGFGLQWMVGAAQTSGSNVVVNFPVPWPTATYGSWIEQASGSAEVNWSPSGLNVNSVTVNCHGPGVGTPRVLAIGR
ncbi:phage tail protein [Pseudomonas argentinensis]|uniref:phage tail-collar fiber domain-containing protein n=1 Tax=Phytopseudomonas argentinensis TaxID=289370 RepID=UPI0008A8E711|nr:phage tail protein [Pseudomonas argentinensis]